MSITRVHARAATRTPCSWSSGSCCRSSTAPTAAATSSQRTRCPGRYVAPASHFKSPHSVPGRYVAPPQHGLLSNYGPAGADGHGGLVPAPRHRRHHVSTSASPTSCQHLCIADVMPAPLHRRRHAITSASPMSCHHLGIADVMPPPRHRRRRVSRTAVAHGPVTSDGPPRR